MYNSCYEELEAIMDGFNKNGGTSHDRLDKLKESGELDFKLLNVIHDNNYKGLKSLFYEFINTLEDQVLENYITRKIILLENSEFIKIFIRFGYELSLLFNNKDAYRNLPLFIQTAAKYFDYRRYSMMNIDGLDRILNRYFNLEHTNDLNRNRYEVMPILKSTLNLDKYLVYDQNKLGKNVYMELSDELGIEAEENAYNYESKYNHNTTWLSKKYGDGFGYDLVSIDSKTNRERLIEVKSSSNKNFTLTKNEFKVMLRSINRVNCDYFIYLYSGINKELFIYNYDPESNLLVNMFDLNTSNINYVNVCKIYPNQRFDKDGKRIVEFYAINEVINKKDYNILTKHK